MANLNTTETDGDEVLPRWCTSEEALRAAASGPLRCLEPRDLRCLMEGARFRVARKDAALTLWGEPGSVFVVLVGRVEARVLDPGGWAVRFPAALTGQVVFAAPPRFAHAVARAGTRLAELSPGALRRLAADRPRVAEALLGEALRQLGAADGDRVALVGLRARERLLRHLARLAVDSGARPEGGLLLRRRPTQQESAELSGCSRETASRELAAMAREGLVRQVGRGLLILPGPHLDAALGGGDL